MPKMSSSRSSRSLRAAARHSSSSSPAPADAATAAAAAAADSAPSSNNKRKAESMPPPPVSSKPSRGTPPEPRGSPKAPLSPPKKKLLLLPRSRFEALSGVALDRLDPKLRGVHQDALQVGIAPTSASRCVDCGRSILKGHVRWGVKYTGNPLPLPVVPLYGRTPMVMWCHGPSSSNNKTNKEGTAGFCGLAFVRIEARHSDPSSEAWICDAARTCHACSDSPEDSSSTNVRVLCGGGLGEHGKVREHAFHLRCWKSCLLNGSASFSEEQRRLLESAMNQPEDAQLWKRHSKTSAVFDEVLTYQDLTEAEQATARRELGL